MKFMVFPLLGREEMEVLVSAAKTIKIIAFLYLLGDFAQKVE